MPSVGMRRTTRVFGARLLRSGRRLWPASVGAKRPRHGDDWIDLLDNAVEAGGGDATHCKKNGWQRNHAVVKHMDIDVDTKPVAEPEAPVTETMRPECTNPRRWGTVYTRKRKRAQLKKSESLGGGVVKDDRRFGKYFVRRKKARTAFADDSCKSERDIVFVNTSRGSSYWLSCLLSSVFQYLRRSTVSLQQIFGFINSEPLCDVYALHGVFFLQDQTSMKVKSGSCVILGVRCTVPVFALDFSTVPSCFMHLHSSLLLRYIPLSYALAMNSWVTAEKIAVTNEKEIVSGLLCETIQSGLDVAADSGTVAVVQPTSGAPPKWAGRHLQLRNSRGIQKRRSSLRSRRSKRSSSFGTQSANAALVSDRLRFRRDGLKLSSRTSPYELRSSGKKTPTPSIKELKSALVELTQNIDTTSCSANILVIESDKCYREEGAVIAMELSAANQWILAVEVGGVRRFNLPIEKVMRPCGSNRVTHDIIWAGHSGWKLEFPDRRDWLIFKELYKECSNRNVQPPPVVSIIPVPGVREVPGYTESNPAQFSRPDTYITIRDDELARALTRNTANYDMDSDDEKWLGDFNDQLGLEDEKLSVESFELLVDTFEKGFYCNPDDDYSDEKAINSCLDMEKKEVIKAVYGYWFKKRKQKRTTLIKIFQCYQPRRTQVIPKSILRKKRSFKRQGSKAGRGKQQPFLQVAERDTLQQEKQNAVVKVQEAKTAANKSEDFAVRMREKAQQLMENADLATYKAMMALKIAEAAKIGRSKDTVSSIFLG